MSDSSISNMSDSSISNPSDTSLCSTPPLRPCPAVQSPLDALDDVPPATNPVSLSHGQATITYQIPMYYQGYAANQIQAFSASLDSSLVLSEAELAAAFLAHLSQVQNKHAYHHRQVFQTCVSDFETRFLRDNDIHSVAASLESDSAAKHSFVQNCYTARQGATLFSHRIPPASALLRAAADGQACIYATFGGQGNTEALLQDLGTVSRTYEALVSDFLRRGSDLLLRLSRDPGASDIFDATPLDLDQWLRSQESAPDAAFIIAAPVSFPLIGLLQLLHFMVSCKCLALTPGEFGGHLKGTAGHSQGIVVAAVIAAADSWESFHRLSEVALTTLFWTGVRAQQAFPQTWLSHDVVAESVANNEGSPTPMLSVRDLPLAKLRKEMDRVNEHVACEDRIEVALINDTRNSNIVVAGRHSSLCALNRRLRGLKATASLDQTRVPFSQRKLEFSNSFLPITAPFHTKFLAPATQIILEDLEDLELLSQDLHIPVFHTNSGEDLRNHSENLIPAIVTMITEELVNWPQAAKFPDATHIIDFGPGSISGIGALTSRMKSGTGVLVILADTLQESNKDLSYKTALFSPKATLSLPPPSWGNSYAPRLINAAGRTMVDTPLTRLLGVPALIVGGMTPTTAHADFVAAVMQAGYHVELAAGGFHSPAALEGAIRSLAATAPRGRGMTVNLIYAAPRAMSWQVPLIARLRKEGVQIEGLTIGAGVPSPEAAAAYFSMGLRHVGFKPGSVRSIDAVLEIAAAYPETPVILQWTGGRGGGHHSCEDFHVPILQRYAKIRGHKNVLLVAGSGFGGADDTYPYLTGLWALKYGFPMMPFDGFLFGSRMMVAKEAHTSAEVKQAIIRAKGLSDSLWEATYKGAAAKSDIITIISEMGEPMHVVGTRGARFWAELDDKVFSKPATEQLRFLQCKREYIIGRLNKDFQKVWFPQDASGKPVDLSDMTYSELVSRLMELLVIERNAVKGWIDPSYQRLTVDVLQRVEERFAIYSRLRVHSADELSPTHIKEVVDEIFSSSPEAQALTLFPEDVDFFLQLCQSKGLKPVPFVPILDENFQTYFKKDSLWQSENLDNVVGQDGGRVLILHGPVAVQYCNKEESAKEILDGIHNGHLEALVRDQYAEANAIPFVEYIDGNVLPSDADELSLPNTFITGTPEDIVLHLPTSTDLLPSAEAFHRVLGGTHCNWRRALFCSNVIMRGERCQENQIKRIFAPAAGQIVIIERPHTASQTKIILREPICMGEEAQDVAHVSFSNSRKEVIVRLRHHQTVSGKPADLVLKYTYHPETGSAPIWETLDDRIERVKSFYWQLWYGEEPRPLQQSQNKVVYGDEITLDADSIHQFSAVVGNRSAVVRSRVASPLQAPLDFGFIVAWKAVIKPLFSNDLDLLDLVHLSNEFHLLSEETPLKEGDVVTLTARTTALVNLESGVMVEVVATIRRHDSDVMKITSRFFYRNAQVSSEETFQMVNEEPMMIRLEKRSQVAALTTRTWFKECASQPDLLGKTLVFRLQTSSRLGSDKLTSSTHTIGDAFSGKQKIGSVDCCASFNQNPAMSFLQRHGQPVYKAVGMKSPSSILDSQGQQHRIRVPIFNARYAQQSGDFNPIHTSRVFAAYTSLPGIITHGMYTSAAVRGLLDRCEAAKDRGRVRKYSASFQGMVQPGDELVVSIQHTAMLEGRKILKLEARNAATDEVILSATAEVEQCATAYIFTGQGSQQKGMGMELRDVSPAAAAIWKRADDFCQENYGTSIPRFP